MFQPLEGTRWPQAGTPPEAPPPKRYGVCHHQRERGISEASRGYRALPSHVSLRGEWCDLHGGSQQHPLQPQSHLLTSRQLAQGWLAGEEHPA